MSERVVVVTGASGGIGRACARAFAERGADVALLARGEAGVKAAAEDVSRAGGRALPIVVDTADPASLKDGTRVREAYGQAEVRERHRHRYEVNNGYRTQLEGAGLVISGTSPDGQLVEFVELPRDVHPYYVSTQAHPEFLSRPNRAHPLFAGLIGAALEQQRAERLVEVERPRHLGESESATVSDPTLVTVPADAE